MPAEWHAKQLPVVVSDAGPSGNLRSPKGKSTLTDFSTNLPAACAQIGIKAETEKRRADRVLRNMFFSSRDQNHCRFHDVAHESGRIPIGRIGLRLAAAACASDHQQLCSPDRWRERSLPSAEAVFALVFAELSF